MRRIICIDCFCATKRTGHCQKRCPRCRRKQHLQACKERWHRTYKKKGYDQCGPKNNYWRGGVSPQYYQKISMEAYGNSCRMCGKKAVLTHHKDGNRSNNKLNNLERLCKRCHQVFVHNCTRNLPQFRNSSKVQSVPKKTWDQYANVRRRPQETGAHFRCLS